MPEPLEIPAGRLTDLVDKVEQYRRDFPGTDPMHIDGFTPFELQQAKAFIARMNADPTSPKAQRKTKH